MRALLEAVYADARGRGYHFLSCCVFANDALGPAYRGFQRTDLAARLFVVSAPGAEADAERLAERYRGARPGFEMALV